MDTNYSEIFEISKDGYRKKVWEFMEKNKISEPTPVYEVNPNFKDSMIAAQKLAELDFFKFASTIKVGPDKPQEAVRYLALESHKTVLVPIPRLRSGLFYKVDMPPGAKKSDIRDAASRWRAEQWGKPIGFGDEIHVDLVISSSVAVSRTGRRIGKGAGYADLEYAILTRMNAVNSNTIIATTVHDCQVFDSLPAQIFNMHDTPVDVIVTPTEVIFVNPRLARPPGIMWGLVSARRLEAVPALKAIRDSEPGAVVLKEQDTDVEDTPRQRMRVPKLRRTHRRRPRVFKLSEGQEAGDAANGEGEDGAPSKVAPRRRRRLNFSGNRKTEAGVDGKEPVSKDGELPPPDGDSKSGGANDKARNSRKVRPPRPRNRQPIEFSLRVSNIHPNTRVCHLKKALIAVEVKPVVITWRGRSGFALLHFPNQAQPLSVIDALSKLNIGPDQPTVNISMEPREPVTRIEVAGITAV